jgi:uncharacterized protein (DUF58 family)
MELEELISTVRRIDILDKSSYKQKLSGLYTSTIKGHGLTFDSIRKYQVADDSKNINWNATARFREPYVNIFTEDKERLVWIVIDVSGSTFFGTGNRSKVDLEIEIGATLAYSALKNNDAVGVIFFSDKIEGLIQPNKGMRNFWHIAKKMVDIKPAEAKTDISFALQLLMKIGGKRSMIFMLSDFMGDDYSAAVKILEQNHKLIAIKVYDEIERSLPGIGWVKLRDSESGDEQWANTSSSKFKIKYNNRFAKAENYFSETFSHSPNTLTISTSENAVEKLLKFMLTQ